MRYSTHFKAERMFSFLKQHYDVGVDIALIYNKLVNLKFHLNLCQISCILEHELKNKIIFIWKIRKP